MKPSVEEAQDALRQIAVAERVADRHSVNNGLMPLVWGVVVFSFITAFGFLPRLLTPERIAHAAMQAEPWQVTMVFALIVSLPIIGTAIWSSQYKKSMPVQAPEKAAKRFWGFWGLYHTVLILGYFFSAPLVFHRTPTVTDCALIGLVDAAPLLYTGIRQWRRVHEEHT